MEVNMSSLFEKDARYISNTYARFPVEIVRGEGSLAYDSRDKRYIDMGAGIGVNIFGYADKEWQNAVINQLRKVQHTSNLFYTCPDAELAEMLCIRTGLKKVFFCNSGAEANECAIKAARKYGQNKRGNDCFNIITLYNSFHGRTLTTLAATGQDHYHELFQPLTPGFLYSHPNNFNEMKSLMENDNVAAVMLECVQGEGGVFPLEKEFLQRVADYAKQRDILVIIDEVQSGNGRSGALYSYMNYGIQPDLVTTAKGLGGGLPIGACLFGDKVETIFQKGDNGSTFGGNPVCCAGAVNILSRITEELLVEVQEKSDFIFNSLSNVKGITSISGMGLMVGFETSKPAIEVVNKCISDGVLCLTAEHNRIRLLPALNIPMDLLSNAIEIIKYNCL